MFSFLLFLTLFIFTRLRTGVFIVSDEIVEDSIQLYSEIKSTHRLSRIYDDLQHGILNNL